MNENEWRDTVADTQPNPPAPLGRFKTWVVNHDRSVAFALVYVVSTIVLSVFVSYFWLLALVGLHIFIEWLSKYYQGYRQRFVWTLWDVKFDLALVCLAFALLSYTGINAGVAGAQSVTRAGLLTGRLSGLGARFGFVMIGAEYFAWLGRYLAPVGVYFSRFGRLLAKLGLRFIDVFFSARVALFRKADMSRARARVEAKKATASTAEHSSAVPNSLPWQWPLTGGDWFAITVIVINIIAVFSAPLIVDHSYASLFQSLAAKLHPWPSY